MKGYFQYLRYIQITGQHISLLPESTHLDTTAATSFPGIMQGFPLSHQFLDIHVRIEHRRITVSLANHLASGPQEPFRRTGTDMNGTSRLQDMQFLNRFKHDIRNFAYPVTAVGFHSSDIQVSKVVVGSAFLGGNTDLRRCRMVIYLDKEAGHQFFGFITGKGSRSYFFFIERS